MIIQIKMHNILKSVTFWHLYMYKANIWLLKMAVFNEALQKVKKGIYFLVA